MHLFGLYRIFNMTNWICFACTFSNASAMPRCEACLTPRTATEAHNIIEARKKADAPKSWKCAVCTFTNDRSRQTCLVCETASSFKLETIAKKAEERTKVVAPKKTEFLVPWVCSQCGYENKRTRVGTDCLVCNGKPTTTVRFNGRKMVEAPPKADAKLTVIVNGKNMVVEDTSYLYVNGKKTDVHVGTKVTIDGSQVTCTDVFGDGSMGWNYTCVLLKGTRVRRIEDFFGSSLMCMMLALCGTNKDFWLLKDVHGAGDLLKKSGMSKLIEQGKLAEGQDLLLRIAKQFGMEIIVDYYTSKETRTRRERSQQITFVDPAPSNVPFPLHIVLVERHYLNGGQDNI
jgi:hypothetical protein